MKTIFSLVALFGAAHACGPVTRIEPTNYEDMIPVEERYNDNGSTNICWKQLENENMCHLWMKCNWDTFQVGKNPNSGNNTGSWCPGTCAMMQRFYPAQTCTRDHKNAKQAERWSVNGNNVCYDDNRRGQLCVTVQETFDVREYGSAWDDNVADFFAEYNVTW